MISSISPAMLYSLPSSPVSNKESMGVDTLKSQASVSVVDTSKFQPSQSSQSSEPNSVRSVDASNSTSEVGSKPPEKTADRTELSDEAKQVINQLQARDTEVRAHEQAHLSAAGGYATGGATYSYQVGPDGQRYAIGGEVGIDVSPISGDPEATLIKANIVQRAALAPAEPSGQDMRVASAAIQMANQARVEIAAAPSEESQVLNESEGSESTKADQSVQGPLEIEPQNGAQALPLITDRNGFDLRMQLQPMA